MTLAQETYCSEQDFDPEDPRCARVILTGNIFKVSHSHFSLHKGSKMSERNV